MASAVSSSPPPTFLDWRDRPPELKNKIDAAFAAITRQTASDWGVYNGSSSYGLAGVDDSKMLQTLIAEAPAEQTDFYLLDIGCGDFQWGRAMQIFAEGLELSRAFKLHIYSVRGEGYDGEPTVEAPHSIHHRLGAFKIEEIEEELRKRGLNLDEKVDLAVSRWTFRHLADPVGTFTQVYNLLRPEKGYLLMDGFFFLLKDDRAIIEIPYNLRMIRLFLDTRASSFLYKHYEEMRSLSHFVLRRPNANKCSLPMHYHATRGIGDGWQVGAKCMTVFKRSVQPDDREPLIPHSGLLNPYNMKIADCYRGDEGLYGWLKRSHLIETGGWVPHFANEFPKGPPPMHIAVLANDKGAMEHALAEDGNIDVSDVEGCTPLHVAIKEGLYEVFEYLLAKGADYKLRDGNGNSLLHFAAQYDKEGKFLQRLLALITRDITDEFATPPIDKINELAKSPLGVAIEHGNCVAIQMLIDAGAEIPWWMRKAFEDPKFASIRLTPESA